jgi:VCBS repeat-containing protein
MRSDDAFSYSIVDAAGATSSAMVHVSVIGLNDAPVALDDAALVQEDALTAASGNVLRNDRDVDEAAVLAVASPGTLAGRYGTLTLAMNGDYSYVLDNASIAVQSLRNDEVALDLFDYVVSDGIDRCGGTLAVSILGANDAPLLAREIADVSLTSGQAFTFGIPPDAFRDADAGDTLRLSATLADGGALPAWLSFDPATQAFSGTAQAGSFALNVSATDQAGAQASAVFTIHAGITVLGGTRNDHFAGTSGDDYLYGGAGNDQLSGGAGNDILQGGSGNDGLVNEAGIALLDGGSGNDTLSGAAGDELYVGGTGNDVLRVGSGFNVISFNSGDGKDTVYSSGGTNVVSLGGRGLDYANLRFEKSDQDLILKTGGGDQITFKDWYQDSDKQRIIDLQVIADAMANFDRALSDPLRNKAVEHFDFRELVHAFDTARATTGVTSWALSNALTQFHVGGSDTEAYGGDLATGTGATVTLPASA